MSPELKDIDRPLGQSNKAKPRRTVRIGGGALALAAGATAIAAVSIALVLFRDDPFRSPPAVAVSTPEDRQGEQPVPEQPPAAQKPATGNAGPSIIRVSPGAEPAGNSVVVIRDPSALGQDLRVAHLPDRALLENSEFGPLPVRGADGRRPLDVYARPWSGARGARVAIVIGGLGISQTGTQEAIARLPAEITLAFAPQGNSLDRWMQTARREGHEIVMQIPLEPFDYPTVDPGRNTLTLAAGAETNLDHLRWALGRTTNYTGVMNYMGARFVADRAAMEPVMEELGRRGLLYLDDGSSARSVAPDLALPNRVPLAVGDAVVDAERDRGAILRKLDELERIARAKGFAVGTGSAFEATVEAVAAWAEEARRRGIELVPVSAVVNDPERS